MEELYGYDALEKEVIEIIRRQNCQYYRIKVWMNSKKGKQLRIMWGEIDHIMTAIFLLAMQ